ncbi:hypothetical protein PGQ11_007037 [Apiospora arundinis]|uniref:Uncharacterized protein n=1 Tax=Apiospora arundinis TaxID=335852 RepID=A0ABR2IUE4_9PEZI
MGHFLLEQTPILEDPTPPTEQASDNESDTSSRRIRKACAAVWNFEKSNLERDLASYVLYPDATDPDLESRPFVNPRLRMTQPDDITVLRFKGEGGPTPPYRDWDNEKESRRYLFSGVKHLGLTLPACPGDKDGDIVPLAPTDTPDASVRFMPCTRSRVFMDGTPLCRCHGSPVRDWLPCPYALWEFSRGCPDLHRVYVLVNVFDWAPGGQLVGPWWKPITAS